MLKRLLLDLLFPDYCRVCGSLLLLDHAYVACRKCWNEHFKLYTGKRCRRCGHPLELLPGVGELCGRCAEGRSFHFSGVNYFTLYSGLAEEALRELKFNRLKPVASEIGRAVAPHLKRWISALNPDLIVPVPVHSETLKERGFNQVEEILKGAGVPFIPLLKKVKKVERQSTLSAADRANNVKGAFYLLGPVSGTVLVIDDVFTTGSTANEVARVLKEGGAERVFVYTVCYTPVKPG